MRLKELFTVPAGQKVTEKHFFRICIASVCGILLCLSCLVGTTWAWFTVSVENTGNEIWIGEPRLQVTCDGLVYGPGEELVGTDIRLELTNANQGDVFQKKSTLYVTLTVQCEEVAVTGYIVLEDSNQYSAVIEIQNQIPSACSVSWTVSWFLPVNAVALESNTIVFEQEIPAESSVPVVTETEAPETTEILE